MTVISDLLKQSDNYILQHANLEDDTSSARLKYLKAQLEYKRSRLEYYLSQSMSSKDADQRERLRLRISNCRSTIDYLTKQISKVSSGSSK